MADGPVSEVDEVDDGDPASQPGPRVVLRPQAPWVKRLALGMVTGGLVVAVAVTAVVGPYLRDDWVLDGIVRAVALDWRDFGPVKARERLQYELDHQGIGTHVRDDSCALTPLRDGARAVRCNWRVRISIPIVERSIPMSFSSEAIVAGDGDLR